MLNLIKAELYKVARRPLYITICIIFNLLIILAGIAMHYAFLENSRIPDFSALVFITINFMGAIPWIMLMFIDIVLEEYKENTLKNLISSSISREKVYLSKYIVQVIIFLVIEITAVSTMIGTSYALGLVGPNGFSDFKEVILRLLIAFPIYISALAIYDFFITIITKKEGLAVVVILGIVSGLPIIFSILSSIYEGIFTLIYPYLLFNPLKGLVSEVLTTKIIGTNIIVGIINTVVFLILGILVIRKQEVK